jgi:hypothetical protein
MEKFDKRAAVFTAVIILAFIGFIALGVAFPTVMTPIYHAIFICSIAYFVYCAVRLYFYFEKNDKK